MKRRTIAWMNRRGKRKMAKYAAAYGFSNATCARYGIPLKFVEAHRNWQRKLFARQWGAEPRLVGRKPVYIIHDEVYYA